MTILINPELLSTSGEAVPSKIYYTAAYHQRVMKNADFNSRKLYVSILEESLLNAGMSTFIYNGYIYFYRTAVTTPLELEKRSLDDLTLIQSWPIDRRSTANFFGVVMEYGADFYKYKIHNGILFLATRQGIELRALEEDNWKLLGSTAGTLTTHQMIFKDGVIYAGGSGSAGHIRLTKVAMPNINKADYLPGGSEYPDYFVAEDWNLGSVVVVELITCIEYLNGYIFGGGWWYNFFCVRGSDMELMWRVDFREWSETQHITFVHPHGLAAVLEYENKLIVIYQQHIMEFSNPPNLVLTNYALSPWGHGPSSGHAIFKVRNKDTGQEKDVVACANCIMLDLETFTPIRNRETGYGINHVGYSL